MGRNIGFHGILQRKFPHIHFKQCIIHREALASKELSSVFNEVMQVVIKMVNFVTSRSLSCRFFRIFASLKMHRKLFAHSTQKFGIVAVARYEFEKVCSTLKINQFSFLMHFEKTIPCPDKIYTFSYMSKNYFQIFWKGFTHQCMSMKNAMRRNDVQCPFIHQSCKTWLHWAQTGRRLGIVSQRDPMSLFYWKKLFIFSWSSVTSIIVSRLSHTMNSIFQLNCMYISTVNK